MDTLEQLHPDIIRTLNFNDVEKLKLRLNIVAAVAMGVISHRDYIYAYNEWCEDDGREELKIKEQL